MRLDGSSRRLPFGNWWPTLPRYLAAAGVGNLLWEALQMPLYTLCSTGTLSEIVTDILVCTAVDIAIAALALLAALLLTGHGGWPVNHYAQVASATVVLAVFYTAVSELVNVYVTKTWTYSEKMILIPGIRVGLAPILQWVIVPALAFYIARPRPADHEVS